MHGAGPTVHADAPAAPTAYKYRRTGRELEHETAAGTTPTSAPAACCSDVLSPAQGRPMFQFNMKKHVRHLVDHFTSRR